MIRGLNTSQNKIKGLRDSMKIIGRRGEGREDFSLDLLLKASNDNARSFFLFFFLFPRIIWTFRHRVNHLVTFFFM